MKVSAIVKNQKDKHEVTVSTNSMSRSITIPPKVEGNGSSVNGAELLLLSLATCYCNDIYREAAKRNTRLSRSGKQITSRRDMKSAVLAAKKPSAAHGRQ